jgi:hypothetical protein
MNFELFEPIARYWKMPIRNSKFKIENLKFRSLKIAMQQSEPPTTDDLMPFPETE